MIAKRGQLQRERNGASGGSASAVRPADKTMKRVPLQPRHPERICWGCDKYCGAEELAGGNGTIRTPHPMELFGGDWAEWAAELDAAAAVVEADLSVERNDVP
jgi:hypothetical protein